ncbi:MAG: aminopeptidase P family protein [Desulfobacterales bacterium]|nr:aminopeptidase P family protein [Desulfobacterales bacterium]
MFTGEKYEKLFRLMKRDQVDCVVVGPSGDMRYLIGFDPGGCERFQALFLLADGRYFYVSNLIYYEDMKNALAEGAKFYLWADSENWLDCLERAFDAYGLHDKTLAVNNSIRAVDLIDWRERLSCKFVNGNDMLEEFRVIKTPRQIEHMRKAARLADEVMEELTRFIKPGLTEKDIQNKIAERFAEKGADETAFAIVASGSNNSIPHYNKNSRVITERDVIVLDFGCKVNGYCSDVSRTFFVGEVKQEDEKIYNIVREAQQTALDYVKEGVLAGDVDKKARDVIARAGYGDHFLSRTGHGIGFDVHEAPYIRGNSKQVLKKGMAFSIEPGVYIAGKVGMRIEDIVIINEDGDGESLNRFTKEITVIPGD